MSASSNATCCESAPRSVPDVASGSTPAAALCFAPYDSRLLGSARPELGAALGIYGAPYSAAAAAQSYAGYLPYSPEPPTLYGALVSSWGGAWVCASKPTLLGAGSAGAKSSVISASRKDAQLRGKEKVRIVYKEKKNLYSLQESVLFRKHLYLY